MKKTLASILLATLLSVTLLAGCTAPLAKPSTLTPTQTTPSPTAQGTLNLFGDDPTTLDPALAGDATSHDYIVQIFSGLVRLDDSLQPVPDIAKSWDISPDGMTYTFHLRNDVKFQDGRQVKADDFKFSLERAFDPAIGSTTALTYLGDIIGVKDMLEGSVKTISGVKVVDDYTLQVIIDSPKSYFLSKMTYPTAFVIDKNNVNSGKDWWLTPNGTGPFKLTRYTKQQQLVLGRNDLYYGVKAKVTSVVFGILSGNPMDLYETGKIDVVGVSLPYIERASDQSGPFAGQLAQAPELSISYIGFNSAKPPFDDVNIRLAFSYAVDKDKLVSVAFKNMVQRADGVLPPGMPGYNKNLAGLGFDVNKAKDLIAKSKYGSVANLPSITLTTSGEGGRVSNLLEVIAYQWKQNLGVDVTIRALEPERYFYNLKSELDQMYDFGWIADYPHPQDFLDILFHSGADYNYGGYANADVDTLLDKAGRGQDFNATAALYQQAEQKLVDEAAMLPLFFAQNYILVKPYVSGYKLNPLGFVMLNNVSLGSH
ncbi:MAG: peptide ABC transporter substrate-binding protein [Chloroflexi bacterium]|nr:peptide ABC transporter substrate-binding protein [Chloroflexota bacterium]